ncbi:probable glucan 1,3-beta-glucosidase A isoform X3 [Panicum virgatum]|uniref:probable glucan 1,3-beta-glucosidase A isoform X3 n=1 Tax=Panicum virgatum TaxID=38727 RepID=UPI0019D52B8E|nr:probable glucan 1,3-beta-glucosidase A isoform X3 [Panicum virgatum]
MPLLPLRCQEDAAARGEATATATAVAGPGAGAGVPGSPRPGGVPGRVARHRGMDPAAPLQRHPQQGPLGRDAGAVQVGAAEDVHHRRPGRRRRRVGQPDAGLRLGDVQAVADQRDDVQLPDARRRVRGHRRQRRHHRRHRHRADAAGDVPDRALPLRQGQGPDQGGKRILRPGDRYRRGDSGLRRAHAVVGLGRLGLPHDQGRPAAAGGVPALQWLRHRQGHTRAQDSEPTCMCWQDHWNTYIVEDDFKFIASSGLTAVRIPVGWWIASDPDPPAPYVGGSLQALDNAFKWAEKYKLGVIIDLHAAPGSQNPWEHSSSRDGTQEWGTTDANIAQTVQVIEFLASRYATSPSLFAVELMNEPLAPRATLDSLTRYYRDGYDAVRRHSPAAYVVMSNRLSSGNATELLQFAGGLRGAVIDVHYYTMFNSMFSNFTVQQNIDFVRTNFSGELAAITTQNGLLTFVGEWVAEWKVPNATKEEYQKYAAAQMSVYGQATFGWSYWTVKNANNHWDLEWMIKNGYISLKG